MERERVLAHVCSRPHARSAGALSTRLRWSAAALPLAAVQGDSTAFDSVRPWVEVALLVTLLVAAVGIWVLVAHLRETRDETRRLARLETLEEKLSQLLAARADLDLRRLEHLLLDLRDLGTRTEEALLRIAERPVSEEGAGAALDPIGAEEVARRRLLSLGYGAIELLRREGGVAGQGVVFQAEATREAARFKGTIRLEGGRIVSVEMRPVTSAFP